MSIIKMGVKCKCLRILILLRLYKPQKNDRASRERSDVFSSILKTHMRQIYERTLHHHAICTSKARNSWTYIKLFTFLENTRDVAAWAIMGGMTCNFR